MKSDAIVDILWSLPAGCIERMGAVYLWQLLARDYEEVMRIVDQGCTDPAVARDYCLLKKGIEEVCSAKEDCYDRHPPT